VFARPLTSSLLRLVPSTPHPQLLHVVRAATNGVVLATEKKVPSILVEDDTMEKIVHYTGNIGAHRAGCRGALGRPVVLARTPSLACKSPSSAVLAPSHAAAAGVVYSGMGPDFRVLVRKGQKRAQQYYLHYGVRRRPPRGVAAL
jgi:20S proteasome subunit alpha 2